MPPNDEAKLAVFEAQSCILESTGTNKHSKIRDQGVNSEPRLPIRALRSTPDHKSILAELATMEGFAETLDRLQLIRSQLDRLCASAQSGRPRIDIPGRATSPLSTWAPGRALRQLP